MHRYEGEAIKAAMFYNDEYQTDEYYIEKFDKRKADNWLRKMNESQVDGVWQDIIMSVQLSLVLVGVSAHVTR